MMPLKIILIANMINKINLNFKNFNRTNKKINNKQNLKNIYVKLLNIKNLWYFLCLSCIGSMLFSITDTLMIYLINPILNYGFNNNKNINKENAKILIIISIGIVLLLIVRSIGSFISQYFIGCLGQKVIYKFRKDIYKKIMNLPASFFDKYSTGQIISKLLYNIDQIKEASSIAIITIIQDGTFILGLITVMFFSSWKLSLFLIFIAPFFSLLISIINKKLRSLSKNIQSSMGNVTHLAEETIRNYKEIRIFGAQKKQQKKFLKNLNYTYSQQIKIIALDAITSPIIQIIASLVLSFSLFIIAIFEIKNKNNTSSWLTAGSFASFFASSAAILKPIKNITKINIFIQKAIVATEDIFYILNYPEEIESGKKELDKSYGNIVIKNLSFSFNNQQVLNKINIDIKSGQTIAFVGKSGSGKSTLANIISRFYTKYKGKIFLDGLNIKKLTLKNLRSHLSIVSQNIHLFDDTIYNNIAFGTIKKTSEQEIINVLKKANAYDFVQKLPNGIYTNIGNNGSKLSGGQRQKISIARALIKNAPILILDEATSALDNESERAIQQIIEKFTKTCTAIIIAHRLNTIENADKIIVMDNGKIVESGTHKELLKNNGLYKKLCQSEIQ